MLINNVNFSTNLTELEWKQINEACDMGVALNNYKSKIFEYVESRMTFIAPNLSMIIGKQVTF